MATNKARVAELIRSAGHNGVTVRELADALYAADPSGGPDDAFNCVRAFVCMLKHEGMAIETATVYRVPNRRLRA